jgi:platelet activating factor
VPVFENLLDQKGQLKSDFTTDGLHLSVSGYQALSSTLKKYIF